MKQTNAVLKAAALAGKIMLESGAEISRVEQTVTRLSLALGVEECEAYATPTAIILSVDGRDGELCSVVRRITQRETRLDRVEEINSLSRRVEAEGMELAELSARLCEISRATSYRRWLILLASGVGAGAFSVFFGYGLAGFLCSFVSGMLLRCALWALALIRANLFVANLAGGAIATLCGVVCTLLGFTGEWIQVTVSVLMLLVPGVAITNALRDIVAGDLVAGLSRAVEAFCIAAALGCGTAAAFALVHLLGGAVV